MLLQYVGLWFSLRSTLFFKYGLSDPDRWFSKQYYPIKLYPFQGNEIYSFFLGVISSQIEATLS